MSGHYPNGEAPTSEHLVATLRDVAQALHDEEIDHVFMGGIGAYSHSRPRVTEDIDVFIRPGDVRRVQELLERNGFEVAEHDPMWLVKAWKRGVLVDVIFRSTGGIYLDDEMIERRWAGEYKGVVTPLIAPEDLLVIKALTSAEANPQHWYDAIGIIARSDLDWPYLLHRARQAGPRRVLSLLLFAESSDLVVPADAVTSLFESIHPHGTVAS